MVIDKINGIDKDIAVVIERLKDQYDNIYWCVKDSANGEWSYEGRGYSLEIAVDDFISDLVKFENKEIYSKRNRTKEEIDKEIAYSKLI